MSILLSWVLCTQLVLLFFKCYMYFITSSISLVFSKTCIHCKKSTRYGVSCLKATVRFWGLEQVNRVRAALGHTAFRNRAPLASQRKNLCKQDRMVKSARAV